MKNDKLVIQGFVEDYGYEALFDELNLDIVEVVMSLYEAGVISDRQMSRFLELESDVE